MLQAIIGYQRLLVVPFEGRSGQCFRAAISRGRSGYQWQNKRGVLVDISGYWWLCVRGYISGYSGY